MEVNYLVTQNLYRRYEYDNVIFEANNGNIDELFRYKLDLSQLISDMHEELATITNIDKRKQLNSMLAKLLMLITMINRDYPQLNPQINVLSVSREPINLSSPSTLERTSPMLELTGMKSRESRNIPSDILFKSDRPLL